MLHELVTGEIWLGDALTVDTETDITRGELVRVAMGVNWFW